MIRLATSRIHRTSTDRPCHSKVRADQGRADTRPALARAAWEAERGLSEAYGRRALRINPEEQEEGRRMRYETKKEGPPRREALKVQTR